MNCSWSTGHVFTPFFDLANWLSQVSPKLCSTGWPDAKTEAEQAISADETKRLCMGIFLIDLSRTWCQLILRAIHCINVTSHSDQFFNGLFPYKHDQWFVYFEPKRNWNIYGCKIHINTRYDEYHVPIKSKLPVILYNIYGCVCVSRKDATHVSAML